MGMLRNLDYLLAHGSRYPCILNRINLSRTSPWSCHKHLHFREVHQLPKQDPDRLRNAKSTMNYVIAAGILTLGATYAAVPLYRMFCQAFSYGGTVGHDTSIVADMKPVKDRVIKVKFSADTAAQMAWNFKPQQREIRLVPGETALAFYTATNPTDVPIIGISTYNIVPFDAGQYFNKIQCFCFEEQMLAPHEQVDMPVFFYIDPEFNNDPKMELVDELVLSYTFFEAKEGSKIPFPSYIKKVH